MTPCQKLLKQEGTARRIESMQQSSATPSLHLWFLGVAEDCCMLSILLAVPSCVRVKALIHDGGKQVSDPCVTDVSSLLTLSAGNVPGTQ